MLFKITETDFLLDICGIYYIWILISCLNKKFLSLGEGFCIFKMESNLVARNSRWKCFLIEDSSFLLKLTTSLTIMYIGSSRTDFRVLLVVLPGLLVLIFNFILMFLLVYLLLLLMY